MRGKRKEAPIPIKEVQARTKEGPADPTAGWKNHLNRNEGKKVLENLVSKRKVLTRPVKMATGLLSVLSGKKENSRPVKMATGPLSVHSKKKDHILPVKRVTGPQRVLSGKKDHILRVKRATDR
jgi:hypothetical protein